MIVVKLNGRMGNHIFQYAFAFAAGKKLRTNYVIDDTLTKDIFAKYFCRLSITDIGYLRKLMLKIFTLKIKKTHLIQSGDDNIDDSLKLLTDNCYYDGYFQSVQFFKEVEQDILKRIRVKKFYRNAFDSKYSQLFNSKKILAIHYRIGDYLTWGFESLGGANVALPEDYYQKALLKITNLDEYQVIIVTDDIKSLRDCLPDINNKMIVSESEIIDFQILLNADTLIISNSSFAWWAAYLNKKKTVVYAPKHWLGFKVKREYPAGIIPQEFIEVEF